MDGWDSSDAAGQSQSNPQYPLWSQLPPYNHVPLPVIAIPGANLAGQYWINQGAQVFFFPYNEAICKLRFKLTKFSYLRLFSLTIHLKFILFYDRVSCQTLNFNPGQIQLTPTPVIISTNTFTFTNM